MRDRFNEAFIKLPSNKTMSGFVLNCDPEFVIDFIEQELKKEREEIVEIVGKEFDRQSESCIQFGHEPILYLPDTKRIIINIIKNRYEQ